MVKHSARILMAALLMCASVVVLCGGPIRRDILLKLHWPRLPVALSIFQLDYIMNRGLNQAKRLLRWACFLSSSLRMSLLTLLNLSSTTFASCSHFPSSTASVVVAF